VRVGVPTEIKTDEYRVSLTPSGVRELVLTAARGLIQRGAARARPISRRGLRAQGAQILPGRDAVFASAS
jgi:alanine dehydrogenase